MEHRVPCASCHRDPGPEFGKRGGCYAGTKPPEVADVLKCSRFLAAVERGDKTLLVGEVKTDGSWKKTILSDCFFRENREFAIIGLKLVKPDDNSVFRSYPAVAYGNEYYCIAVTDTGEFPFPQGNGSKRTCQAAAEYLPGHCPGQRLHRAGGFAEQAGVFRPSGDLMFL